MAEHSDTSRQAVIRSTLADQGSDDVLLHLSPAERIKMVWPITKDCWAFVPGHNAEQEFQ